jgi:hypothetical protein
MTTSLVAPNHSHHSLIAARSGNLETWKRRGVDLLVNLQATHARLEGDQWAIGDWLVEGADQFKEKAYDEAVKITGFTRGSLYTIVWVTRRFSDISLRSETELKWSHFKELARITDENTRTEVLTRFSDGFSHSVVKVREHVDSVLKKTKENPKDTDENKPFVYLRVALEPAQHALIKSLAEQKGETPHEFLSSIVHQYLKTKKRPKGSKSLRRSKSLWGKGSVSPSDNKKVVIAVIDHSFDKLQLFFVGSWK